MARRYGISTVIQGSLAIAALSTLGDFIWATWIPRHRPAYGMTHGTLLFLAIGFVLGVVAHRRAAGAIAGALIGAAGAAGFYLLAPLAGYAAMFLVWIAIWVALGVLAVWLMTGTFDLRDGLTRGAAAAVASGAAFYAISGIWRPFDPRGWDYATHFGAWTLAYLPGFLALLVARRDGPSSAARVAQVRRTESWRRQRGDVMR